MFRPPPTSTLFPYTTLFRSGVGHALRDLRRFAGERLFAVWRQTAKRRSPAKDRKSTRLNSSHANISYAVFCLKKKKKRTTNRKQLNQRLHINKRSHKRRVEA